MADIPQTLNDLHKTVFSKKPMPKVIPEVAKIQKNLIKFRTEQRLGDKYRVGVRLSYPTGFTHKIGDGTAGVFGFNEVRGGTQKKAEMTAYQTILRDWMSYEDAAKATAGEASFVNGVEFFYEGLQASARKRIESQLLYGQVGMGVVSAYSAANAAYTGSPATITITSSEWAPQIWAGNEGADLDVMSGVTSTVRGTPIISGVDVDNKTLILSAAVTGCVAGDVLYFKGCFGQEMVGIHSILGTTSGSLFGIPTTNSLWKPNNVALGSAPFSFKALKRGISQAVGKGLYGEVNLLVNPGAWDDLQNNIETLRKTDKGEVKKVDVGAEEIVYHSQNGTTKVIAHPMVKEGYAYGLYAPTWSRVGSVDLDLGAPGFDGAPWFNLPNNAGVEARIYTNQGIICEQPAVQILFTGIKNSILP